MASIYGKNESMHEQPHSMMRKITVNLPAHLLEGMEMGTTELIREALKTYRHQRACEQLKNLRGKVTLDFSYATLKAERE